MLVWLLSNSEEQLQSAKSRPKAVAEYCRRRMILRGKSQISTTNCSFRCFGQMFGTLLQLWLEVSCILFHSLAVKQKFYKVRCHKKSKKPFEYLKAVRISERTFLWFDSKVLHQTSFFIYKMFQISQVNVSDVTFWISFQIWFTKAFEICYDARFTLSATNSSISSFIDSYRMFFVLASSFISWENSKWRWEANL